jgi:hypothetical protein
MPAASAALIPPLWFLGLQERLSGDLVDRLPRGDLPARVMIMEEQATARYRSHQPALRRLSDIALQASAAIGIIVLSLSAWNNRRLPVAGAPRTARGVFAGRFTRHVQAWLVPSLVSQAAFFLTLRSLSRSVPHRAAIATSLAVGLAITTVGSSGIDLRNLAGSVPAIALLAVQPVLIVTVLIGFRHAARVPVALHANWTFHLSWNGDERAYLAGVKRAGLAAVSVPILAALFPLHVWALGSARAVAHLAAGFLLQIIVVEALFANPTRVPFISAYLPDGRLKTLAPAYLVLFLLVTYGFASVERNALSSARGTLVFLAALTVIVLASGAVRALHRRALMQIEFTDVPETATQRLNLSG